MSIPDLAHCDAMSGVRIEIQVTSGPLAGRRFEFDRQDTWVCGRSTEVQMSLAGDGAISRQHFMLEVEPPRVRLTDLGSRNGTYVNNVRFGGTDPAAPGTRVAANGARTTLLADGDEIAAGASRMRVRIETASVTGVVTARCPLCGSALEAGEVETLCPACVEQLKVHPFQKIRRMLLSVLERLTGIDHPELPGFDITGELGRGGMARVFRAVNRRTGATVAIKVILPEMASNPLGLQLFKREIEVTRQLKHPCIVDLMHPVIGHGACLFIMEFVDGTDLFELAHRSGGKLPIAQAAPIFLDVLEGLAYAHRAKVDVVTKDGQRVTAHGIVHRDLKPTNILVYEAHGRWHGKVADFGLAKAFGTAGLSGMTSAGSAHGTPAYWPREQLLYFRYLNPPSDVFSAAAVFYQTLTGVFPRNGVIELVELCRQQARQPSIPDFVKLITEQAIVPLRSRDPTLPPHVCAVIDRALAEPTLAGDEATLRENLKRVRFPDGAAFLEALREALEKDQIGDFR